ncbi:uncharacterized protein C8A04DRAFT_28915 [Dichotomopilus funicola]|uniref:Uncharacterized protein n=1 Tax=Dichotomopilus funicola TaxID=1934379 RepID=A0AAN6ZMV2_9PEZI|nr:hypothetical protein C8A04DRAFT_28915 [Dichotomopilus funicola]
MCTYDYTPYTGCEGGPQHYYIQWVKCDIASEKGRYCSLDTSHKVEQLRKLSSNVLSCPLHGPIAVQQFVLDSANPEAAAQFEPEAPGRTRARSTTRRGAASRGRTPKRGESERDVEQSTRKEVRKRRSRREMVSESSDSESAASVSSRRRTAERPRRRSDREPAEPRRRRVSRASSHNRSTSADIESPPPVPSLTRYGRSEVSLPTKMEPEMQGDDRLSAAGHSLARPKTSLDIPRVANTVGLPTSPDMHRRGSDQRRGSETGSQFGGVGDGHPEPVPSLKDAITPTDSSPDHNPEMPFSTPGRRTRRTGSRSVRDLSVDPMMRRIDEHVAQEGDNQVTNEVAPSEAHTSTATSPEPLQAPNRPSAPTPARMSHHRRTNSKPQLNNLKIPQNRDKYQRDAYSAPTATPPETDITADRFQSRTISLRNVDVSPVAPPLSPRSPRTFFSHQSSETASIHSNRSRRYEDQVIEARKWAAAREQVMVPRAPVDILAHMSMSETSLPLAAAAAAAGSQMPGVAGVPPLPVGVRESVDSGYLSGHHTQRSWEAVRASDNATPRSMRAGRNTLQKMPPPVSMHTQQDQAQAQAQAMGLGLMQDASRRTTPAPLNLNMGAGGAGLPPCALPVSLVSPGFAPTEADLTAAGKGGKGLLHRMGLRRKFSGLVA